MYVLDLGPCPYLEGRSWRAQEFGAASMPGEVYEALLVQGFRRSGLLFYKPVCTACARCVPLRLDAERFEPSPSQRRLVRRNSDVRVELSEGGFSEERFSLYRRYLRARHGGEEEDEEAARRAYVEFLVESPLRGPGAGSAVAEYRLADGRLIATGYIDLLPAGLSSVYFAFDPDESRRSLGTWSVLRELALALSLGRRYYYLGFWVPGSRKMDYKAWFRPFEYAQGGRWMVAEDAAAAFAALEGA